MPFKLIHIWSCQFEIVLEIKILYRLYDMGLASYKRSKDPETQWFTYSWKFETEEVISRIRKDSEKYLKMLNDELEREENNIFENAE